MSTSINEFLDAAEASETPATPEPVAETTTTPDVPSEVTPDVAMDAEPAEDADSFDRKYVEKLRKESAGYRERAKRFESAFDGFEESDQEVLLGLAKSLREDPTRGAQEMAAIAKAIMDQIGEGDAPEADAEGESEYLTVEKYKALKEQEAVEDQVRQIEREAVDLGYKKGSPEYQYLLAVAKTLPDADLSKAHAQIKAREQAAVDAYLAQKQQQAGAAPKVPGDVSTPASSERTITNFKDARAALEEYISSGA